MTAATSPLPRRGRAAPATATPEPAALAVLWSLNGLRAAGAILVMLYHINSWDLQIIRGSSAGYTGVGLFFVLSGFVLTWTARPGVPLRAFYTRRLARILPNHLTAFVLGIAVTVLVVGSQVDPTAVVAGLLLLQAWSPDGDVVFAINGVAWSLSCEIAFYAAFPLLLRLLRRMRPTARVAVVGAALLTPVAIALVWPSTIALLFHLPLSRLPEFALGMVTALAVQEGWRPRIPAPVLLGLLGACILGAAAVDVHPTALTALLAVIFAPLAARCAWGDIEGRNRWARHPAVKLGGALSFTFYLLHELVIKTLVASPLRGPVTIPVVLVVSAVLAFAMWRLVELPARAGILARTGQPGPRPPGQHGTAHRGPQHGRTRGADQPGGTGTAGVGSPALAGAGAGAGAGAASALPTPHEPVVGPAAEPASTARVDEADVATAGLRTVTAAGQAPDAATTWALRTPAAVAWGVTAPAAVPALASPPSATPTARPALPPAAPRAQLPVAPVVGATALATTVLAAAQEQAALALDAEDTDTRAARLGASRVAASQHAAVVAARALVGRPGDAGTTPVDGAPSTGSAWAPPAPPTRPAHPSGTASGSRAWQPPAPPVAHRYPVR